MRAPVYRNLDRPFQILGFSPLELTLLAVCFTLLGELAQATGVGRVWSLLITLLTAGALHWFRRGMGDRFAARLVRFLALPSELHQRLLRPRTSA